MPVRHGPTRFWIRDYPVLGVTVRIECDDPAAAELAESALGHWRALPDALRGAELVTVRVVRHHRDLPGTEPARIEYRLSGAHRLTVRGTGSVGYADDLRGKAVALVSQALLSDEAAFQEEFLEALVLFLVAARDRAPFHAAALVRNGQVALLAGSPGAGKSTLAYAAASAGWSLMAEDLVWIQRRPRFRLWGLARTIKLPREATRHFPSLVGARRLTSSQPAKLVVDVPPALRWLPPVAESAVLVLLERGRAGPRLESVDRVTLGDALRVMLQPGFDRFPDVIPAVVEHLGAGGGWRLMTRDDPGEALDLLDRMLAAGADQRA